MFLYTCQDICAHYHLDLHLALREFLQLNSNEAKEI